MQSDGSFSLGHNAWPGLGKCIEESGELNQVFGKIIANKGATSYWGALDLREKLVEELADDLAAKFVFIDLNMTPEECGLIELRMFEKMNQFQAWYDGDVG